MKRGKMLGGKPPRRGGRMMQRRPTRVRTNGSPELLTVLAVGFLIVGIVAGFAFALNNELTAGILRQRDEAARRPDWVPLNSLPDYVGAAFVVAVDPGFEEAGTLRTRQERSSSIPRELVREIHMLGDGLGDHARELLMAPLLERRTTKDDLLALYLNRVYLGQENGLPIYGVGYAAQEYFGERARDLTLSEAATLAGLLLEPRIETPEDRAGAIGARRNEVLEAMRRAGYIDERQFAAARAERLPFQPGLAELPMSRMIPIPQDTAVIRLPPEYRPRPDSVASG